MVVLLNAAIAGVTWLIVLSAAVLVGGSLLFIRRWRAASRREIREDEPEADLVESGSSL
jgi:hypothetical protein